MPQETIPVPREWLEELIQLDDEMEEGYYGNMHYHIEKIKALLNK